MIVVLHPEQAAEVSLLSKNLELPVDEVVRHLLSGPLLSQEPRLVPLEMPVSIIETPSTCTTA